MTKETLQLDLKFQLIPRSPVVGMTGKEIETNFGVNFVHAHPNYLEMMDEKGNLDMNKIKTDKNYVVKSGDYIRVDGDYEKVADFGIKMTE